VPKSVIADSSALVALLRYDDQHHRWLDALVDTLPKPWLTCEPALTETLYLVGPGGTPAIKEMLRRGALILSFDLTAHLEPVLGLMDKYADIPMSLADACLVRMTEILPDPLLVTIDEDFRIYRRHSRKVIPCLMP
jgi:predicted nucleic acid-binding protein